MRFAILFVVGAALLAPSAAHADALIDVRGSVVPALPGVAATGHGSVGWAGAVATEVGLADLRAAGYEVRVRIADLAAQERADREADARFAQRERSALPSGNTAYRHLADYESEMATLAKRHRNLVMPLELAPETLEQRTIQGIEITHDVGASDGKPVLLMVGLHHAREWPSGEHSLEFAYDLIRNDGSDPRITRLLNRVRVIVIPVVNADGFNASREAPYDPDDPNVGTVVGIPGNGTSYRRKNCRATGQSGLTQPPIPCDLNPGVDLNRNYGINWGSNGASSFEQAPDYRGASPFSEPESEAIRRLVSARQVTMLITNHTFGNQVLRPPGVKSVESVPDEPALKALADSLVAANGYSSERSWQLYDNSGTTEDWSYGVTGGFGYTFEIGSENFHPAFEQAVVGEYLGTGDKEGLGNREAYLRALAAAADPAGHAIIEGFAPPGRELRLRRVVEAKTGPVCITQPTGFFSTPCGPTTSPLPFTDTLTASMRVPASGVVEWHVNPSGSPQARSGPWELSCQTAAGTVHEGRLLTLARGGRARIDLACGLPSCPAGPRIGLAIRHRVITLRSSVKVRVTRVGGGRVAVRGGVIRLPRRRAAYVVVARSGGGVTRRSILVRGGRARRGPRFAADSACGELSVARLRSPVGRPMLLLRSPYALRARVNGRAVALRRNRLRKVRVSRRAVVIRTRRGASGLTRRSVVRLRAVRR